MGSNRRDGNGGAPSSYTCPVCMSPSTELLFALKRGNLRRCIACGHAFSTDISVPPEDVYTGAYFQAAHRNWFNNPDYELYDRIRRSLARHVDISASILDVGCGTGNFLKYLHDWGYTNLHGLDLMKNEHESIRFYHSDFFDIEFDHQFDVVVSMMNIEHVYGVHAYLAKMRSVLKATGLCVINTIDESSFIYWLARFLKGAHIGFAVERLYDIHHVNHFSVSSLRRLCFQHGLTVLESLKSNYPLESLDVGSGLNVVAIKRAIGFINFVSVLIGKELAQTVMLRKSC